MSKHPVDDVIEKWNAAMRRSDTAELASLVTEDYEFWSPGQPPLAGRGAVRDSFDSLFKTYHMEQSFEERERIDFGDAVLLRGVERNHVTPRKGVGETTIHQRVFTLLRRDADGVWRIARGMSQFLKP
jgi:uncharacterized protein (TIGR02246 family)